ncbi:MAG TPA: pantoate--beta-alanine ligase, partial [Solirubrobacteraceae bacterium]|nr:pantoate--beta-alanine ligase [Solirubrobacteraceae bacterium]
ETVPIVRDPDGLAMSSRNALLSVDERPRAVALPAALAAATECAAGGERSAQTILAAAREAMRPYGVEPEYLALVAPDTLEPIDRLDGETLLALAARIGETRLIDNAILHPATANAAAAAHAPSQPVPGKAMTTCSA